MYTGVEGEKDDQGELWGIKVRDRSLVQVVPAGLTLSSSSQNMFKLQVCISVLQVEWLAKPSLQEGYSLTEKSIQSVRSPSTLPEEI